MMPRRRLRPPTSGGGGAAGALVHWRAAGRPAASATATASPPLWLGGGVPRARGRRLGAGTGGVRCGGAGAGRASSAPRPAPPPPSHRRTPLFPPTDDGGVVGGVAGEHPPAETAHAAAPGAAGWPDTWGGGCPAKSGWTGRQGGGAEGDCWGRLSQGYDQDALDGGGGAPHALLCPLSFLACASLQTGRQRVGAVDGDALQTRPPPPAPPKPALHITAGDGGGGGGGVGGVAAGAARLGGRFGRSRWGAAGLARTVGIGRRRMHCCIAGPPSDAHQDGRDPDRAEWLRPPPLAARAGARHDKPTSFLLSQPPPPSSGGGGVRPSEQIVCSCHPSKVPRPDPVARR